MTDGAGVVILTHRDPLQYAVVNYLAARCAVRQVIYEAQGLGKSLRLMARRVRRVGLGRVLAQAAYVPFDRLVVRPAARAAVQRMLAGYDTAPPRALPQLDVDSINSEAAAQALRAAGAQVVIVSGTSILKPRLLRLAPVFINIHAGLTPRYRGAHGAFWAVWEGRPELAGVTVHLIDPGIDTGDIVAQTTIALEPGDNPRTLAARQTLAGLPLLVDAVRRAQDNTLTTRRRADLESRLWHTPTIGAYLQFRRQMRRLEREGKLTPPTGQR